MISDLSVSFVRNGSNVDVAVVVTGSDDKMFEFHPLSIIVDIELICVYYL